MEREATFWGAVTAISLALLLVLLAQDRGWFEDDTNSSNESPDSSSNSTEGHVTAENSTNESSNSTSSESSSNSTADSPDPLALECLDHDGLARHDHVTLQIFIDGEPHTVEAAVGIQTDVCNGNQNNMHAVHTHSDNGVLHVELNEPGDVPLGVFFDIWGYHFNETGIFDYRVNSTHEFAMYVHASNENATEEHRVTSFDDYLILNGEVIELHFRVKAD